MPPDDKARARLKLPSGLEIEAEGQADFVRSQLRELLSLAEEKKPASAAPDTSPASALSLDSIIEQNGSELSLRSMASGTQESCLLLLLGSERLLRLPRPTAAQLARWLRTSGHTVGRIDRILSHAVSAGQVLAAGSRRSRRYELAPKGRIQALLAAERLAGRLASKQP